MRFEVHPSDDGRWFILDTERQTVFLFCGNELLARKVARILNQTPGAPLYDLDSTKLH
jgi:hypothetical protein